MGTSRSSSDDLSGLTHLVIVCGHGTYRGSGDVMHESSWILAPFQTSDASGKPSEHFTFIQHILCGVAQLEQDEHALLVLSGGHTQKEVASTEAESYLQVLKQVRPGEHKATQRIICENNATDSYQNLLFSLLQFRLSTGRYPERITVITHAFKSPRFFNCHGPAIKWPADSLRIVGLDPPLTGVELDKVKYGENANAFQHFVADPYGVKSPLADKRMKRGYDEPSFLAWLRDQGIERDVYSLAAWHGGESGEEIFPGQLPWTQSRDT